MARRLGLYLGRLPGFDKAGFDRSELIDCVLAAEGSGYDSFWLPEAWERDAFSVLAELAVRTTRIGLGAGIVNVFSRSPALIAMSAATLDEMSGGRFRLGLGTSGPRVVEDFHGVRYEKPLERLRETALIVRALLSGEQLDFNGSCFRIRRFKLGFKPIRPAIPIYFAALSPKSLRQAGAIADGWLPTYWPLSRLREGISEIEAGAEAAGRDPSAIDISPFVNVVVNDDAARARNAARLALAYYIGGMGYYYHRSLSRLGFAREADLIREMWRAGRPKEALRAVSDGLIDAVAICGDVETCRARLDGVLSAGANLVLTPVPSSGTTSEKCKVIESLAILSRL
jgi:F420-dependent oxidoreductase-like protein